MTPPHHYRLLLVDDNPAIHDDFRKILLGAQERDSSLEATEAILFGIPAPSAPTATFEIVSAHQGKEALEKLQAAVAAEAPFALAFVDVRMPPGWDGIETVERLWNVDPSLQVVICTAYADYSWEKMAARLGASDSCVILKKPFDNVEVLQLAHAMTKKWSVTRQAQTRADTLDRMVRERTSELQLANAELHRSEERFSTAFRCSPAPMAIQRLEDQRFIDVNEAFSGMTGFTRLELIGRAPLDLPLCIDYEPSDSGCTDFGGSAVRNVDAQVSTKEGDLRSVLLSIERIRISNEPHLLLIAQDVTERLRLETQLRQAQKMEAIGQLAAGIAHDFNNLLTIIQGHSSLQLSLPGLSADASCAMVEIEEAAKRAAALTRQLLAFSRRQIMRPKVLSLGAMALELSAMLSRLIGEQIELRYEFAAGLPEVCADPTSVEQIIINLVVNARDAMPKGGRVTIGAAPAVIGAAHCVGNPEAQVGEYVRLSVADIGIGMDSATRGRIFEPFFTTKEVHKGTGMGLATVYGLAKQHRGWVEVFTAPGAGSTFYVYFPVASAQAAPAENEPPVRAFRAAQREHTILVVEDDESVRGLVKDVLLHNQYRVLEAEHAAAALEVWEEHASEIELLLTDIVMPGEENGLELSLRLLARKPDLKVIYTSGYSSDLFGSDIPLQDGINYLPKPYLSSKLTEILRKALEPLDDEMDENAVSAPVSASA